MTSGGLGVPLQLSNHSQLLTFAKVSMNAHRLLFLDLLNDGRPVFLREPTHLFFHAACDKTVDFGILLPCLWKTILVSCDAGRRRITCASLVHKFLLRFSLRLCACCEGLGSTLTGPLCDHGSKLRSV